MSPSIDISETHKEIVQAILREHLTNTCHVWVFGSRATWLAKEYSDLDLAIARKDGTPLSLTVMSALEMAFEDSLLPWKVDVIDLHSVSEEFRAAIERDKVLFSLRMEDNWELLSIKDFVDLAQGFAINKKNNHIIKTSGDLPLLRITDLIKNTYSQFIDKNDISDKFIAKTDELIYTRTDQVGLVFKNKFGIVHNNCFKIKPRKNLVKDYLYWFFYQKDIRDYVNSIAAGSVQKDLNHSSFLTIKLPIPNINTQKAIAHILGTLDDKIELNRQTNQTLEAMAQALFQSWFVDFDPVIDKALAAGNEIPEAFQAKAAARQALGDQRLALPEEVTALFPDAFVFTEEMGWVPEGWEVNPLAEIIEIIGGGTPKTSIKEYWDGDIPWFSVVDAPNSSDIFVIDTEKHITATGLENSSTRLLNKGTTIISARGTVGKCAMVGKPMAMNQSCYGIHGKKDISNTYIYYSVLLSVSDLQRKSHGSVFGTITRDTFKLIQIPFCGEALTQLFDHYIEPSFEKVLSNCNKNISLTTLRDTLLPKLISGELRIADAGGFLGEVGI